MTFKIMCSFLIYELHKKIYFTFIILDFIFFPIFKVFLFENKDYIISKLIKEDIREFNSINKNIA